MDDVLKCIQRIQLEMAIEVKRLCNRHNIKYFLIAGSALGAVRHKGFIPWDDDLDIGMLRIDYERFLVVANKEINKEYLVQNWDNENKFAQPFTKIRRKNTEFVEKSSEFVEINQGIFIDVFPYDTVPENRFIQTIQALKFFIIKRIMFSKLKYTPYTDSGFVKKIIFFFIGFVGMFCKIENIKKRYLFEVLKFRMNESSLIVNVGGAYKFKKEILKRVWLEELIEVDFENTKFPIFKSFNEYLSLLYGDYMIPPPENKRYNRHNITKVKFMEEP